MPVEFVSAGCLEGTIKDRQTVSAPASESDSESDVDSVAPSSTSSALPPDNTRAMAHMAIRSPSPAASEASSGSSDEVVFRGRGNASAPLSTTTTSRVESPLPPRQAVAVAVADAVHTAVDEVAANAKPVVAQAAKAASIPVEHVHANAKVNISIRVKGVVVPWQAPSVYLADDPQTQSLPLLQSQKSNSIQTPTVSPAINSQSDEVISLRGKERPQHGNTSPNRALDGCLLRIVQTWMLSCVAKLTLVMPQWTTTCRISRTLV